MLPSITVFGLVIPLYTLMAVVGIIVAMITGYFRCRRLKGDLTACLMTLTFGLLFSILGASLFYYIFSYDITRLIAEVSRGDWSFTRSGGLVFYGGLICGLLGSFCTELMLRGSMEKTCDVLLPVIPLGHAFGRVGCIFAGCCFGMEYDGFLAVTTPYAHGTHLPVAGIEAVLVFLLFFYLQRQVKRRPGRYRVLFSYLSVYAMLRFILEYARGDAIRGVFGSFSTSQWISIGVLLFSVFMVLKNGKGSMTERIGAQRDVFISFVTVFWLCVWHLTANAVGNALLLPGPGDALRSFFTLAGHAAFWESVGTTLLRVITGYAGAILIGCLLAFLCHFCAPAELLLSPVRSIIRATPVASFIILLWLWLSKGTVSAFISFLMVVPIIWSNVQEGLKQTDPRMLEMARAYRFTGLQTLRELYLPAIKAPFTAACATGLGFAWKSGISAEVIARPLRAIGTGIADAKVYLETGELFAWTLTVILISMLLEKALMRVIRGQNRKEGAGK